MAVNCSGDPLATDGLAGVTAMESSAGAVTVRTVLPFVLPTAAWIVVEPVATVAAVPAELIVATLVADELQVAVVVRLAVLLSV